MSDGPGVGGGGGAGGGVCWAFLPFWFWFQKAPQLHCSRVCFWGAIGPQQRMQWGPNLTIPGSVSAEMPEDPGLFDAHRDWPAQEIVALKCQNLTRSSGARLLDPHFDWPAQNIIGFKCQNLTRASGAPLLDAHIDWPAQRIVA